jgi:hypothetical protein
MKHPKQWKFKLATCTMGKKEALGGACLLSSCAASEVPHLARLSSFLKRSPTGSKAIARTMDFKNRFVQHW